MSLLQLEQFLPFRLSVVSNALSEAIAAVYRDEHGLSLTEWRLLAVLAECPGETAQRLVQRTRLDKVSISRGLKALVGRGLVERGADRADARRRPLRLSEAGSRLYQIIAPAVLARARSIFDALPDGQMARLDAALSDLAQVLASASSPSAAST